MHPRKIIDGLLGWAAVLLVSCSFWFIIYQLVRSR